MKNAVLIALLFFGVVGSAERALGQFFVCSAGPNDGGSCESDDDCLPAQGGACVVIQGVCDGGDTDGFPCDCPSGVCDASPACSSDTSLGTCRGGSFNTDCCDTSFNCESGAPCVGSQKICCTGTDKGFSCLNNTQCTGGGSCVSTGKFCSGGDFDSYTCCDNSDCGTGSECIAPDVVVDTPTKTPTSRTSATPTVPVIVSPSVTKTPTTPRPSPTGTLPTVTRTPQAANTPTLTATVPAGPVLIRATGAGDRTLLVSDASLLPTSGTVLVDSERMRFSGVNGNLLLNVERGADGTAATGHASGASVVLVDTPTATPQGGPSIIDYTAGADGACAMSPRSDAPGYSWVGSMMLAALAIKLRRRS